MEGSPIIVQCFEKKTLKYLKKNLEFITLVQLVKTGGYNADGSIIEIDPYDSFVDGVKKSFSEMLSSSGLDDVATYAQGIGKNKNLYFLIFIVFYFFIFYFGRS